MRLCGLLVADSLIVRTHREGEEVLTTALIQERSGCWLWKKLLMASTSTA